MGNRYQSQRAMGLTLLVLLGLVGLASAVHGQSHDHAPQTQTPGTPGTPGTTPGTTSSTTMTNLVCPVMTWNFSLPAFHSSYQGKEIYFCCERCVIRFKQNPQAYVGNLSLTAVTAGLSPGEDVAKEMPTGIPTQSHKPHGQDESGQTDVNRKSSLINHLISWLGKFHPMTVHFPIAMLVGALVALLLGKITGHRAFDAIGSFCIGFAAISAILAGLLGWFSGGFTVSTDGYWLTRHRWLGTGTVVMSLLLAWVRFKQMGGAQAKASVWAKVYATLLVIAVLMVGLTGYLGGVMMFGPEHYNW